MRVLTVNASPRPNPEHISEAGRSTDAVEVANQPPLQGGAVSLWSYEKGPMEEGIRAASDEVLLMFASVIFPCTRCKFGGGEGYTFAAGNGALNESLKRALKLRVYIMRLFAAKTAPGVEACRAQTILRHPTGGYAHDSYHVEVFCYYFAILHTPEYMHNRCNTTVAPTMYNGTTSAEVPARVLVCAPRRITDEGT